MELTFVSTEIKLKVKRNRSKHASANHTMTDVFSSCMLLYSLSRTTDLYELPAAFYSETELWMNMAPVCMCMKPNFLSLIKAALLNIQL